MTDATFLMWIADRFVRAGESPNVDFVLRLRRVADMRALDRAEFDALLREVVALREWKAAQEAALADVNAELSDFLSALDVELRPWQWQRLFNAAVSRRLDRIGDGE